MAGTRLRITPTWNKLRALIVMSSSHGPAKTGTEVELVIQAPQVEEHIFLNRDECKQLWDELDAIYGFGAEA